MSALPEHPHKDGAEYVLDQIRRWLDGGAQGACPALFLQTDVIAINGYRKDHAEAFDAALFEISGRTLEQLHAFSAERGKAHRAWCEEQHRKLQEAIDALNLPPSSEPRRLEGVYRFIERMTDWEPSRPWRYGQWGMGGGRWSAYQYRKESAQHREALDAHLKEACGYTYDELMQLRR